MKVVEEKTKDTKKYPYTVKASFYKKYNAFVKWQMESTWNFVTNEPTAYAESSEQMHMLKWDEFDEMWNQMDEATKELVKIKTKEHYIKFIKSLEQEVFPILSKELGLQISKKED